MKTAFDRYLSGENGAASSKWRDIVLAARDDLIFEAMEEGKVYVETSNSLTFLAPSLAEAFPASRFIHLHRHPYEVIRSGMVRRYYGDHPLDFAHIRPRPNDPLNHRWDELPRLEKIAWRWAATNDFAAHFLSTLPAWRGLELRADRLFAGDAETLLRLFSFVDVTPPAMKKVHRVLRQRLNAENRIEEYPSADGWSEADRSRVRDLVGSVAARLGYEL